MLTNDFSERGKTAWLWALLVPFPAERRRRKKGCPLEWRPATVARGEKGKKRDPVVLPWVMAPAGQQTFRIERIRPQIRSARSLGSSLHFYTRELFIA